MMTLGLLLVAAALFLTGYNLWGEYQATKNANEALLQVAQVMEEEPFVGVNDEAVERQESDFTEHSDVQQESAEEASDPNGMTVRMVNGIDYIGIIEIPTLSLKLPIISEWDDAKLKIAPCRYVGSAYNGDLIISGHSYKNHFRYIRNLAVGEPVIFTDFEGTKFVYEVTAYEVVNGTDVETMLSGEWDMSLFTCTYNGSARHTVRCKLVPEENPWMAEREVPASTYQGMEIDWSAVETVGEPESVSESEENPDHAAEAETTVSDDEEDEAIYQDADLENDLEQTP